jgi:hypothetical protein
MLYCFYSYFLKELKFWDKNKNPKKQKNRDKEILKV